MKEVIALLWAVITFATLWWFAAKMLFPWVDGKRERRDPIKNRVFLDDILKEKQ